MEQKENKEKQEVIEREYDNFRNAKQAADKLGDSVKTAPKKGFSGGSLFEIVKNVILTIWNTLVDMVLTIPRNLIFSASERENLANKIAGKENQKIKEEQREQQKEQTKTNEKEQGNVNRSQKTNNPQDKSAQQGTTKAQENANIKTSVKQNAPQEKNKVPQEKIKKHQLDIDLIVGDNNKFIHTLTPEGVDYKLRLNSYAGGTMMLITKDGDRVGDYFCFDVKTTDWVTTVDTTKVDLKEMLNVINAGKANILENTVRALEVNRVLLKLNDSMFVNGETEITDDVEINGQKVTLRCDLDGVIHIGKGKQFVKDMFDKETHKLNPDKLKELEERIEKYLSYKKEKEAERNNPKTTKESNKNLSEKGQETAKTSETPRKLFNTLPESTEEVQVTKDNTSNLDDPELLVEQAKYFNEQCNQDVPTPEEIAEEQDITEAELEEMMNEQQEEDYIEVSEEEINEILADESLEIE